MPENTIPVSDPDGFVAEMLEKRKQYAAGLAPVQPKLIDPTAESEDKTATETRQAHHPARAIASKRLARTTSITKGDDDK